MKRVIRSKKNEFVSAASNADLSHIQYWIDELNDIFGYDGEEVGSFTIYRNGNYYALAQIHNDGGAIDPMSVTMDKRILESVLSMVARLLYGMHY